MKATRLRQSLLCIRARTYVADVLFTDHGGVNTAPGPLHSSDNLAPKDKREGHALAVLALALEDFGIAHACDIDAEEDFSFARLRRRELLQLKNFWPTLFVKTNYSHALSRDAMASEFFERSIENSLGKRDIQQQTSNSSLGYVHELRSRRLHL
jgi:hypothetical protein